MFSQVALILLTHIQSDNAWELFCRILIPIVCLLLLLIYFFTPSDDVLSHVIKVVLSTITALCIILRNCHPTHEEEIKEPASKPPEPPKKQERPKKIPRKIKKKKRNTLNFTKSKYKNMDEAIEGSTKETSKPESFPTGRTKVYSPLELYQQLSNEYQMDESKIYYEFQEYLLSEQQRIDNGFPIESPKNPGKIITNRPSSAGEMRCCRCHAVFYVKDGKYASEGICCYHVKKLTTSPGGHESAVKYSCCGGDYKSSGCKEYQYHVTAESFLHDVEFVKAKRKNYLKKSCSVFALDCEMCYTTAGMEVCKVGIVSLQGLTLYETFVLPENDILDYNTCYSGVCANDLKGITTTLADVQAYLLKLLNENSILVGHSLENDLKRLKLIHNKVVDTSVLFPHQFTRYKRSLKALTKDFLNKSIQDSEKGHDCIEDSRACLELVLWKIISDLKNRPPVYRDENRNALLQNNCSFSQSVHQDINSTFDNFTDITYYDNLERPEFRNFYGHIIPSVLGPKYYIQPYIGEFENKNRSKYLKQNKCYAY